MSDTREGFPFRFSCQRSGNCCSIPGGVVHITDEDATAIARYLGVTEAAFRGAYMHKHSPTLRDGQGTSCIFLDGGASTTCRIYPVRPQACRTWPFWPELLNDPERLAKAMRLCPGIKMLSDEPEPNS